MITGELRNKVDSLWEMFWTGGLTNPLDVIEQITYLMFIRDIDEADRVRGKECLMLDAPFESLFPEDKEILRWSVFRDLSAPKMYDVMQAEVFPFIKNLHSDTKSAYAKYMGDAIFKIPTPLLLEKIVTALDEMDLSDRDVRGDLYEYLLSKIATAGTNGQFRTPRHIIRMMVELLAPGPEDIICDPACGTSGFLVCAGEYILENHRDDIWYNPKVKEHYHNKMFFGYDMDRTMLRIGAMNLMSHGITNPNIAYRDSLSEQNPDADTYSVILTNPPFKGSLDYDIVSADLLKVAKTKKTELLFLSLFVRMLKVGGRCAVIVPDGVLFGSSKAHKAVRKMLIEEQRLEAVISMPSGVFKPYAGVSTAVLIFTKTNAGGTDKVWFYDMQADGYTLDDKRAPTSKNDIPDIITRFHSLERESEIENEGKNESEGEDTRERTEKSFCVPKDEIIENGYDLSINKYKKIIYEVIEYPAPREILAEIRALETEITKGIDELEGMLE
ncbi:type I restriction-modification system subunit M [Methanogenium marinum]|uniref:site-specific DNA-methyltransferase (adenine-specific) n=1 Tax=Methanogenium marinum TaxID=348610 RepID=A0A9Q4KSF3_9EURY|nr:class I SAM-dependent DNA methyltransferase [Methanogenium marinum]MDE4907132.1 type I restriction-modification system subunit M [Methanogenium marinum]